MNIVYSIIIYPITQIIEFVFVFSQNLLKETGFSIICVSIVVSVLCLPLYMVAEKWQEIERNKQKSMSSKITKIKSVFKGDEQYLVTSAYYRQNHYHPVYAMRSTFGLLIQIPFFLAAYTYLTGLEVLKGSSFLFLKDLGSSDMLIPIAGGINALPVIMTLINIVSGILYTRNLSIKDKVPVFGMALVFLVLLYNSASGLVLYWTINNVFSLLKNGYLKLNFRKKRFLLFGIISVFSFLMSYYTIFIFHGNPGIRVLIAVLSVFIGILPWIGIYFYRLLINIKYIHWTSKEIFYLFSFSILVLFSITGLFIPALLIESSPQEFSYIDNINSPLFFLYNTSIQSIGLFIFWPLMIYFLFSDKIKNILAVSMTIIAFSALCNIFLFPGNYGLISINLEFERTVFHDYTEIIINLSVLALIFVMVLLFYLKGFKRIFIYSLPIVFIALIFISSKSIYVINKEYDSLSKYYIRENISDNSPQPIIHLSKNGNNLVVIMLDKAASVFIPFIFGENPELNLKYDGFVYYPNTVSFNGWTAAGAPPIFGGYEYTPQEFNNRPDITLKKKNNESLQLMPMILSENDFSVTITDPPYADGNWIPDLSIYNNISNIDSFMIEGKYTNYWLNENKVKLPSHIEVLKRNILWYAIFREVPLAFRQGIYYNGSWCAPFSENRMRLFLNGYTVLNYLDKLTDFLPLQKNSAVFMTNNTSHERLFLQAPLYVPQIIVTDYGKGKFNKEEWYHVNAAAIYRLSEYFDFLKSNDVYNNTRIILVSDHGVLDNSFVTKSSLPFHIDQFNPILLVKDFNSCGELKTDMTFMSTADVPVIAMEGLVENPINPFTDNKISSLSKKEPLLVLIKRVQHKNDYEYILDSNNSYLVQNNIFDEKNWKTAFK